MTLPCTRPSASVAFERAALILAAIIVGGLTGCATVRPSDAVVKRAQLHMGTIVTVTAVGPSKDVAHDAVVRAFREIHRLEELWSGWIPSSEVSRVNAAAGRQTISVSKETMTLLQAAGEVARLTEGKFSIAVGPAVGMWSVADKETVPSDADLERVSPLTVPSNIHLDPDKGTVYLSRVGMSLDIGGIGKGYAADLAVEAMRRAGATAGVVALSGDIKTFGRLPGGQPFPFGIRHPRREGEILVFVDLQDQAISTAGDYERYFERDGVRYHHILDPATLKPARECQSVSVIAREGVLADGLDTGIFVLGPERGMQVIEALEDVEAVIVDREGRVLISSGLRNKVRFPEQDQARLVVH